MQITLSQQEADTLRSCLRRELRRQEDLDALGFGSERILRDLRQTIQKISEEEV